MWVWPQLLFGGSLPQATGGSFPEATAPASLFPPRPVFFCDDPGGAAWAAWAGMGEAAHGGVPS